MQVGFAQPTDTFLPKTIIFKVKEAYRSQCFREEIKNEKLNQLFIELGLNELSKIFPNKQQAKIVTPPNHVDLSLIYQFKYTNPIEEEEVIWKLNQLKLFEYVERYVIPQLAYTPNDTAIASQYFLNLINAFNAWDIQKGDTNIVVGVTDTGWDPTHPDLLGNVKINYLDPINGADDDNDGYIDNYMGWDLGMNDNDALFESTAHGVYVTGLAAAVTDNTTGVASPGFKTKFLPIKISNSAGFLTHAYQGVVYAADHGCFVINCSWGSYTPGQFQKDIIDYATINKGCLVIGAVGNDDGENVFYPAGYDGVLSVAASEQSDLKKNNSNYGYYVNISAPGEAMYTTGPAGSFGLNGGTSMAAPVVAGGAALVKAQFPSYNNQQIAALLQTTADDLNALNPTYIDKLGKGRLDLFDALTVVNPQFLELTSSTLKDKNNNLFSEGDTINVVGLFTNYLTAISGVSVTLTSSSPFLNIIDGITNLPNLNVLDTVSNFNDPFLIEVLNGAGLNETVLIKVTITNGSYSNTEYFTIILNQNYINLAENQVATSITSVGKTGYNDVNNTIGLGFTYKGEQLLYEAGLMVGDASSRVSDVVRGASIQDQDFLATSTIQYNPPFISALDLVGIFDDNLSSSPIGISIKQHAYAFSNAPDDKYVIVMYDIENTSGITLNNLYAGIFADWDIDNPNMNKAGVDVASKMGYVHSVANDTIYAAIKLLSSNGFFNYSLDMDGSGGVDVSTGGFTTAEKYTTLSSNRASAGGVLGSDVGHVVSTGSFNLIPGQHEVVAFAIIAGDSLLDIQNSATAAQLKYDGNPLAIDEKLKSKEELFIYPNPTNGIFYINTQQKIQEVMVKNLLGEVILSTTLPEVNLSNYAKGVYLVEVTTETAHLKQKLIRN
ncbi:MAG: S8 family peptidase [Vicingus serpentipes]|nr:S8 family peptidase [Vicingus serpentipes]